MCAIAGLFSTLDQAPTDILSSLARAMGAQACRGPDGSGVWTNGRVGLAVVRLAVTGGEVTGAQPLFDSRGGVSVFNGEIYNARAQSTNCDRNRDAEDSDGLALVQAIWRNGVEGLRALRGPFACARYDSGSGRLILVRDALGKKPLYLRRIDTGWAFASTLAGIYELGGAMRLRDEAIYEYLVYRSVGADQSSFNEVQQVPPGGWVEIGKDGQVRSGRWWRTPEEVEIHASAADVHDRVDEAVAMRVSDSWENALYLSGGLDSSIIAASLRRQSPNARVYAISVGYDVMGSEDERPLAARVARHFDIEHHTIVVSQEQVPDLLCDVARLTEDPIQDPVTVATLTLARATQGRTKVVLTGDGADEVWGGYSRFDLAPETLSAYLQRTQVFTPEEVGLAASPASYVNGMTMPSYALAPLDRIMRLEVVNRMRNYHLARVDKILMGCGIEPRAPFVDQFVVDFGLRIAAARKRPGERPKGLLAAAFSNDLPRWLLGRAKQPFSVPIRAWLSGPLLEYARDILESTHCFSRGIVDPSPYFANLDQASPTAAMNAHKLWSLLQIDAWYRAAL